MQQNNELSSRTFCATVKQNTYVCFYEGVRHETLRHAHETSSHHREEYSRDSHVITGNCQSGLFTSGYNGHGSWYITDRHLIAVFLNF